MKVIWFLQIFSGSLGNWVSKPNTKVSSEGILTGVNPGEHQCSIENGQCYWTDIETAMEECFHWPRCFGWIKFSPVLSNLLKIGFEFRAFLNAMKRCDMKSP